MWGDLVDRFLERGKTGYLVLAGLFVLGLAVSFFLDVWLLGSLVAYFADAFKGIFAGSNGTRDFSASSWYFHHPFATAWAWLVTPGRLSNPGIRTAWFFLTWP